MFSYIFKANGKKYLGIIMHGMIYIDGQVNCKKLSEYWADGVDHRRLIDFLNHGVYDIARVLKCQKNTTRLSKSFSKTQ